VLNCKIIFDVFLLICQYTTGTVFSFVAIQLTVYCKLHLLLMLVMNCLQGLVVLSIQNRVLVQPVSHVLCMHCISLKQNCIEICYDLHIIIKLLFFSINCFIT